MREREATRPGARYGERMTGRQGNPNEKKRKGREKIGGGLRKPTIERR